jgi:hypothetical protein
MLRSNSTKSPPLTTQPAFVVDYVIFGRNIHDLKTSSRSFARQVRNTLAVGECLALTADASDAAPFAAYRTFVLQHASSLRLAASGVFSDANGADTSSSPASLSSSSSSSSSPSSAPSLAYLSELGTVLQELTLQRALFDRRIGEWQTAMHTTAASEEALLARVISCTYIYVEAYLLSAEPFM